MPKKKQHKPTKIVSSTPAATAQDIASDMSVLEKYTIYIQKLMTVLNSANITLAKLIIIESRDDPVLTAAFSTHLYNFSKALVEYCSYEKTKSPKQKQAHLRNAVIFINQVDKNCPLINFEVSKLAAYIHYSNNDFEKAYTYSKFYFEYDKMNKKNTIIYCLCSYLKKKYPESLAAGAFLNSILEGGIDYHLVNRAYICSMIKLDIDGFLASAIKWYKNFPDIFESNLTIAEAFLKLNQKQAAIQYLEKAYQIAKESKSLSRTDETFRLLKKVFNDLSLGDKLKNIIEDYLEFVPDHINDEYIATQHYDLSLIYFNNNMINEAIKNLILSIKMDPQNSMESQILLSSIYLTKSSEILDQKIRDSYLNKALKIYRQLFEENILEKKYYPFFLEAAFVLGKDHYILDLQNKLVYSEADEEYFRISLSFAKSNAKLGLKEEAIRIFEKLFSDAKDSEEIISLFELSDLIGDGGIFERLFQFTMAKREIVNLDVYSRLLLSLTKENRLDEASSIIELIESTIENDSESEILFEDYYNNKAYYYLKKGDYKRSFLLFHKSQNKNFFSDNLSYKMIMTEAYNQKKYDMIISIYELYEDLIKSDRDLDKIYNDTVNKMTKNQEQILLEELEENPRNKDILINLSKLYFEKLKFEEALKYSIIFDEIADITENPFEMTFSIYFAKQDYSAICKLFENDKLHCKYFRSNLKIVQFYMKSKLPIEYMENIGCLDVEFSSVKELRNFFKKKFVFYSSNKEFNISLQISRFLDNLYTEYGKSYFSTFKILFVLEKYDELLEFFESKKYILIDNLDIINLCFKAALKAGREDDAVKYALRISEITP